MKPNFSLDIHFEIQNRLEFYENIFRTETGDRPFSDSNHWVKPLSERHKFSRHKNQKKKKK